MHYAPDYFEVHISAVEKAVVWCKITSLKKPGSVPLDMAPPLENLFFFARDSVLNPFKAPEPLPILNTSNFVPKNGFPVVEGLISYFPTVHILYQVLGRF